MAWRQPWDVVCPRCYVDKGRVCRSPYSLKSMGEKCHSDRWTKSLLGIGTGDSPGARPIGSKEATSKTGGRSRGGAPFHGFRRRSS